MSDESDAGVGDSLGDAGALPVIVYKGRPWTLGAPTQRAKNTLEELVVEVATANVDRLKGALPPAKYLAKCNALDAKIEGGHYKTWGPLWSSTNSGPDGQALFLCALLRERQPEATIADARNMLLKEARATRLALARVVPDFFALLADDLSATPEERAALLAKAMAEFLANLTPGECSAAD